MDIAAYFSLLLILSLLLVKSADLVEDAFVLIAKRVGVSPFVIGFFILATMSSLPEISVALTSAIDQVPELSVGNLLGASFTLITLVIGLNTIAKKDIPFKGRFSTFQVILSMVVLLLQVVVILDGQLKFEEGVLLICAYSLFSIYIAEHLREHHRLNQKTSIKAVTLWHLLLKAILGIVGLILIAKVIVDTAIALAAMLHVPSALIGVLVLAFGTNLPEITILFRSKNSDTRKLAVGNFLGSATLNTGIMGFLVILAPHHITALPSLILPMVLMAIALVIFCVFAFTGHKISRKEGLVLIGLYAAFVVIQVFQVLAVA